MAENTTVANTPAATVEATPAPQANGEQKTKKAKTTPFESFYADADKLHAAAEASKAAGNKALVREAKVEIDGKTLYVLCYNPEDALLRSVKHVTLEKMGIKVTMLNEVPKAAVAKIVTADSLLAAMAALPEAERLKVQAAMKAAKPAPAAKPAAK